MASSMELAKPNFAMAMPMTMYPALRGLRFLVDHRSVAPTRSFDHCGRNFVLVVDHFVALTARLDFDDRRWPLVAYLLPDLVDRQFLV